MEPKLSFLAKVGYAIRKIMTFTVELVNSCRAKISLKQQET
jgi:hypothetical protein